MKTTQHNQFRHFRQFFVVNFKYYAIYHLFISAALILVLVGYTYLIFMSQPQMIKTVLYGSFWTLINICGIILTTSAFYVYGNKSSAIPLLTTPVSTVTRLLTVFIYSIPLLLLSTTLVYTLTANVIEWIISSMNFVNDVAFNPLKIQQVTSCSSNWNHFKSFLILQSITLMAGSFFPKFGFLKSIVAFIVTVILYCIITNVFLANYFDCDFTYNFFSLLTNDRYTNKEILKQMPMIAIFWQTAVFLVIPLCWYISYLRIKEYEI